jgi:hypothetical protein
MRLDLLRTPRRPPAAHRQNRCPHLGAHRVWTGMRRVAARGKATSTLLPSPRQHLIARLPAYSVPAAKLRHRGFGILVRHARPSLPSHRTGLLLWHRLNLRASSDDHLDLLPILPVCAVTHHAGSDRHCRRGRSPCGCRRIAEDG